MLCEQYWTTYIFIPLKWKIKWLVRQSLYESTQRQWTELGFEIDSSHPIPSKALNRVLNCFYEKLILTKDINQCGNSSSYCGACHKLSWVLFICIWFTIDWELAFIFFPLFQSDPLYKLVWKGSIIYLKLGTKQAETDDDKLDPPNSTRKDACY